MTDKRLLKQLRKSDISLHRDEDGWFWTHKPSGDESMERFDTNEEAAMAAAQEWKIESERDLGLRTTTYMEDEEVVVGIATDDDGLIESDEEFAA